VSYVLGHEEWGRWWWGESRKGFDDVSHIIGIVVKGMVGTRERVVSIS
jgi:hypothetical protein